MTRQDWPTPATPSGFIRAAARCLAACAVAHLADSLTQRVVVRPQDRRARQGLALLVAVGSPSASASCDDPQERNR
jgi:hypothetical protein